MTADHLPDLASRALGGSVVYANDELFAERENLIKPQAPVFRPGTFGAKGQLYDGWETRRRREPGHDHAIVRLGAPGVVRGAVIDTAHFTGNFPPQASVEGAGIEGYPSPAELAAAGWVPLLAATPLRGDAANTFTVDVADRITHVRLSIYPDGGVARLRVPGVVVVDPRYLPAAGLVDLAAAEHGGVVVACSNMFYGKPGNLLLPGLARDMGDGWETARRRDDGNDWLVVRLAAPGRLRLAELDTSHFKGNAPAAVQLSGVDERLSDVDDPGSWRTLLPRTRLQPDTRHRLRLDHAGGPPVTRVRLDAYPDGGLARVRLYGSLDPADRAELGRRWFNTLPAGHAGTVLAVHLDPSGVRRLIDARPLPDLTALPAPLLAELSGVD
jgi:allantoicase